jgi:hypothetical protein
VTHLKVTDFKVTIQILSQKVTDVKVTHFKISPVSLFNISTLYSRKNILRLRPSLCLRLCLRRLRLPYP